MEERILHSADFVPAGLDAPLVAEQRLQAAATEAASTRLEIAVIDARSPLADASPAGRAETVVVAADEDGIERVTAALAGRNGVTRLHLVPHGGNEGLQLGRAALDAQALFARADAIAGWGDALSALGGVRLHAEGDAAVQLSGDLAALLASPVQTQAPAPVVEAKPASLPVGDAARVADGLREIAFVDGALPDAASLVADLQAQRDAGRAIEVRLVAADEDGLAAIGAALAGHEGLTAVHLVSHGGDGYVQLGATRIDAALLASRAAEVGAWSGSLGDDADLLLYGCDVAASAEGIAFADTLAALTGADVAASDDATGAALQGGDWILEHAGGVIEALLAPSQALQSTWQGVLATYNLTPGRADGTNNSLRWAITQARNSAGADTIVLAAGTYSLTLTGLAEDANASGDLDVNDSITILGAGAGTTFIDAGNLATGDRVFHLLGGSLALRDLTVQGGSNVAQGGAVLVTSGNLSLNNVVLQNNSATSGGAIYQAAGTLTLTDSSIRNNIAQASGGGVFSNATLSATRVTMSGNTAGTDGGALRTQGSATLTDAWIDGNSARAGGGIYSVGPLQLDRVTVSGNTATQTGGGLHAGSAFSATNLTVSGNTAGTLGGGLYLAAPGSTLTSATLASNIGGGVYSAVGSGALTMSHTLLAGNSGGNANLAQTSAGWNLDTDGSAGLAGTGDIRPASAGIAALAANGGYAPTHALLGGSAALDAGGSGAPATDQRGLPRYRTADIGAFETQNTAPTISALGGRSVLEDGSTGPVAFTVSDGQSAAAALTLRATSSNAALVAPSGIVFGGSDSNRTVTVTPLPNAAGSATITVYVSDGSLETASGFLLTVTSVNDAPSGTDATLTLSEDLPLALRLADFGLRDPLDSPANALGSVTIVTPPAAGSLRLNGSAVAAAAVVNATDIAAGRLVYVPVANRFGSNADTLVFRVRDDGGTANGGVDTAAATNTLRFDVLSVNDAPAGTDRRVVIDEDGAYTFAVADFGYSDLNDAPADTFASVRITTVPVVGALRLAGTPVVAGASVTTTDIAAGRLVYTPPANANGNGLAGFTFQVRDSGGNANGGIDTDPTPRRMDIDVRPVNDAPSITLPAAQTVLEDSTLVLGGATGNALSIADADASTIELTLSVDQGTLSLTPLIGAEQQVNLTTASHQQSPRIAVAADGHYVVVWQSNNQDGSKFGIFARIFNADGSARSGEIAVNTLTLDDQTLPTVAIDSSGRFVVAWQSNDPAVGGTGWDVYARTFAADGTALAAAKRISNTSADDQKAPAVAIANTGEIVIAWQSRGQDNADAREGIYARRFNITLGNIGNEFLVNSTTLNAQTAPAIARNAATGEFVIVWASNGQDGSGSSVQGQRYSSTAAKVGSEFRVNTTTASDQEAPAVAINAGGDFVVAWQSKGQDNPGDGLFGIYVQRYSSSGTPVGPELRANTTVAGEQTQPAVALAADGRFAVGWASEGQAGDPLTGVYLQGFAADGAALGGETRVNSFTAGAQEAPSIGMDASARIAAVWQSQNQDGNSWGVFAQRLKAPGSVVFVAGDGLDDPSFTVRGGVADLNEALGELRYTPRPDFWGSDTLRVRVDDLGNGGGAALVANGALTINVSPVNDAPTLTVPGAQASDEDVAIVFSAAGGNAISLADRDADPQPLQLSLSATNGTIKLATTTGLSVVSGADGGATLVVRGRVADLNAALEGLRYRPNADYIGSDLLSVAVDDLGNVGGGPLGASGTVALTFAAVNDAPVNQLPAAQSVVEGNVLTLSTAKGNRLFLADVDSGVGTEELTLIANNGTLALARTNNLSFSAGTGRGGETRLTFRGKLVDINLALDGLVFTPTAGYAGPASIELLSNDLGNSGAGGGLGDRDVLRIDVRPDANNDAPVITLPAAPTTAEEVPLVFSQATNRLITVVDDAGGNPVQVTLTMTGGTLTLANSTGPEYQVTSTVVGDQQAARVAMTSSGAYVVVWQSAGQDGSGQGIYAQQFDANRIALAPEFRVNTTTDGDQTAPAVATDASGGFAVVWQSADGAGTGIYLQRYAASGAALGGELRVNTRTAGNQSVADIAMDAAGNFVVVWQSDGQDGDRSGIYGQRYSASGVAQGSEFRVNTTVVKQQTTPAVAMDASGGFVVAWQSEDQDGDGWGIYAQRYAASGATLGAEFRVNTITFKDQTAPAIAMSDAGAFVIAWQGQGDYTSNDFGIYAQRYDAGGTTNGPQFRANVRMPDQQTRPSVAMNAAGDFVIAWQSKNQDHPDHDEGIYARRYDADGTFAGGEFLVNSTTARKQIAPSVSYGDRGRFMAVWTSEAQDGSGLGVFGQGFFDPRELVFSAGDGIDDATLTFTAPLELVNDALNGMVYTPARDFDGAARLTVSVNDLGNSGGAARTSSRSVNVTVTPVNDAPTITVPAPRTVTEGTAVVFSSAAGTAIAIADADAANARLLVTLSASTGTLSLGDPGRVTLVTGTGTGDATMSFTATLANIATAMDGLRVNLPTGYTGEVDVQVRVDDQGNAGSGGALVDARTARVTVAPNATNSAPSVLLPNPPVTAQDVPIALSLTTTGAVQVVDDAGTAPITVTLTVSGGTVSLSPTIGRESTVNSYAAMAQDSAAIAMQPGGGYVVVWRSNGQDASGTSVHGQRYDDLDRPVGSEFRINTWTPGNQGNPAVAVNRNGAFVVAWVSDNQDGSSEGIYAQRFGASGQPVGAEMLVNTTVEGAQLAPSVAITDSGAFVVAWESSDGDGIGIQARVYDAAGEPLGEQFSVNTVTAGNQRAPDVAMDAAGNLVVVWQGPDGDGDGIYARRFAADGSPLGFERQVNTATLDAQTLPSVAMRPGGEFVVAWQGTEGGGGIGSGIYAQRFDAAGQAAGGELHVNTLVSGNQTAPDVAISDSGVFAIVWQGPDANNEGVQAQLFRADGSRIDGQVDVNTTTAGDQVLPAVGIGADGRYVVAWTGDAQDGSGTGIARQRMARGDELAFSAGSGRGDTLVTMRGSTAFINAALDGLRFTPTTGFNGVASIRVDVNDEGNAGTGGALTTTATLDIVVGKPPVIDLDADNSSGAGGAGYAGTYTPGTAVIAVGTDATVVDSSSGNLASMTAANRQPARCRA